MYKVLFVCTGNICRSPTAEGVFKALIKSYRLSDQLETDSAGIGSWHEGSSPDPRSVATAKARGVDISKQKARTFKKQDFKEFDLVLCMDSSHEKHLLNLCPANLRYRIRLFLDYAPEIETSDIPDPYFDGNEGFEKVYDMIKIAAIGLIEEIKKYSLSSNEETYKDTKKG